MASDVNTMSVSHMNSHGARGWSSRNSCTSEFRALEILGPDLIDKISATLSGDCRVCSSDSQNSVRTVPPCTYPMTTSAIRYPFVVANHRDAASLERDARLERQI